MVEKLSITIREIIRFFFTGAVVLGGISLHYSLVKDAYGWLQKDASLKDATLILVMSVGTFFVGYVTFFIYRSAVYEWLIFRIKAIFASKRLENWAVNDYRTFIQDEMAKFGRQVSALEAERLYRILRADPSIGIRKYIKDEVPTGLHFMYFLSIAVFVTTATMWPFNALSLLLFMFSLLFDISHERDELLAILRHRDSCIKVLEIMAASPIWRPRPVRQGGRWFRFSRYFVLMLVKRIRTGTPVKTVKQLKFAIGVLSKSECQEISAFARDCEAQAPEERLRARDRVGTDWW